jgi:hypothetical protein
MKAWLTELLKALAASVMFALWSGFCFCAGILLMASLGEHIAKQQARLFVERQAAQ